MTSLSKLRFGKELNKLTISDIQLLIDNKIDESQNLDYKQPGGDIQKDCDNLGEVISAFLNTDGGLIIYGVAESADKEGHRFPTIILWNKETKERIENLLISRVQPWFEGVIIQRIANDKEPIEGVYVIEVPKSNNPPHMFNDKYYQRLNFQSKPMSHESVYRAFQTSWIRRSDLITKVIQPLYSEIKSNDECIKDYCGSLTSKYDLILENERYLYDLLEIKNRKKIDEFYDRLRNYQGILNRVYKYTTKLINDQLCRMKPNISDSITRHMNEDNFLIDLCLKDAGGNTNQAHGIQIRDALLKRRSLKRYLESIYPLEKIIKITPIIMSPHNELSMAELKDFWNGCKANAKQNGLYLLMWKERQELLKLSKNILKDLAN
jgi:hypothetical protein